MSESYTAAMEKAAQGWRVRRQAWGAESYAVVIHGKLVQCGPEGGVRDADAEATDWEPLPYIVAGEWRDPEWWALSKETTRGLTADELRLVCAGPKRHPFDLGQAWQVMRDGETLIYPSKEVAEHGNS